MQPLVIYHGNCRDGFCAAWAVRKAFPESHFFPGFYGKDPPNVLGRRVIMVDFSYPPEVLKEIADKCKSLLVLDHHKTAEEALKGFKHEKATIEFDMSRSGAGMAWDTYHGYSTRPWLVSYVEDRDLWKQALPDSTSISALIGTLEFDFDVWDRFAQEYKTVVPELVEMGKAVERKTKQYVREVAKNVRRVDFHGYNIPVVNAPQVDISELLNFLANDAPFSMGWWQLSDGSYTYGLRSKGDFDVSEIAKRHGGGGHKNAAGFQLKEPLVFE